MSQKVLDKPQQGTYKEGASDSPRKSHVIVIGGGLAGLTTALELVDKGYRVTIYETRKVLGGKVASWTDRKGNHIEMGLHVFFGCYYELFQLMNKLGLLQNLLLKQHQHQYISKGGKVTSLDFRFANIGSPWNGLKAFFTTQQLNFVEKVRNAWALATSPIIRGLFDFDGAMEEIRQLDKMSFSEWFLSHGGSRSSLNKLWNPIAYALGFIDCDEISARCMLTIFLLFATRTEASVLRMLKGSPAEYLTGPMVSYLKERNVEIFQQRKVRRLVFETIGESYKVTGVEVAKETKGGAQLQKVFADAVVVACDVRGAQQLLPEEFRRYPVIDGIFQLQIVPVITVQLRFDGWVTELKQVTKSPTPKGIDNLLYSADVDFSCFADLACTSPENYFIPGQGSLLQLVVTPAEKYMKLTNEAIVERILEQVRELFPSSRQLECLWSSVVKLGHSLYRESPNCEVFRPPQETPIEGLFLAGSYTAQDYIDSMEGAVKSGRLAASAVYCKIPVAKTE
eukprot:jgi/Galph1/2177/GphlegSOOS_G827.1